MPQDIYQESELGTMTHAWCLEKPVIFLVLGNTVGWQVKGELRLHGETLTQKKSEEYTVGGKGRRLRKRRKLRKTDESQSRNNATGYKTIIPTHSFDKRLVFRK